MKWIGQHIWSFISRFRNDVYLEDISDAGSDTDKFLVAESDGKIAYRTGAEVLSDIGASSESTDLEFNGNTANGVLTYGGAAQIDVESTLTFDADGADRELSLSHTTNPTIKIENTTNDVNDGAFVFVNKRGTSQGTGSDGDDLGSIFFKGGDSAGNETSFAQIIAEIGDATDGQEAGELSFKVAEYDGTLTTGLFLDGDTDADGEVDVTIGAGAASVTTIAGDVKISGSELFGPTDNHLSIKSDGSLYFVMDHDNDSGAGEFTWNTDGNPGTSTELMTLTDSATLNVGNEFGESTKAGNINIWNSVSDANGPTLTLHSQRGATGSVSDAQDDDVLGSIIFSGFDDGTPLLTSYVSMRSTIADASNSNEAGKLEINAATQGVLRPCFTATGNGSSTRTNVDIAYGTSSITTIAGDLTTNGEDVIFQSTVSGYPVVEIKNTNTDTTGPELKLNNTKGGSTNGASGDFSGKITFNSVDASQNFQTYASMYVRTDVATHTEESGNFLIDIANDNGSLNTAFSLVGGSTTGEVDATIGCGTSSLTTIAGLLHITGDEVTSPGNFTLDIAGHIGLDVHTDKDIYFKENNTERFQFHMDATPTMEVTGDFDIDCSGEIELNADGGSITFKDDSARMATFSVDGLEADRKFGKTSSVHFEHMGDVIYFGSGSTTQGDLCYLKEDGSWGQADADGAATGDDEDRDAMGMLAIALGGTPLTDGMLIRGMITMDYDLGDCGNPVYVSTTAGEMSSVAPTASGDFVRVVGYCLDDADGQMYFNPDNTWVEIA